MPIETLSGEKAVSQLKSNPYSRYPAPHRDANRYLPYPSIAYKPRFSISPDDKIFTIGSCFARNIEKALVELGIDVLSSFINNVPQSENITNKYTTRSIIGDLKGQFKSPEIRNKTIYGNDEWGYFNLTFGGSGTGRPKDAKTLTSLTQDYFTNLDKIKESDIIIITLGLVEVWYDKVNEVYLNIPPPRRIINSLPDRFELHVLSYEEIVADIKEILSIIRQVGKPNVRFLLTVSPVPLSATYRDQDCLQANVYSKAVQRAAIEEICLKDKNVSYFPSFEMVALAPPQEAWIEKDFRHVKPSTVTRIMKAVVTSHMEPGYILPEKEELKEYVLKKDYYRIIYLIEGYLRLRKKTIKEMPTHCQYYYACALYAVERYKDAKTVITPIVESLPKHVPAQNLLNKVSSKFEVA